MNLVTGATGIVGSHVVLELLRRNQPVVAAKQAGSDTGRLKQLFSYYIPNAGELFGKIQWVELDVRDILSVDEALQGISTVYHCAGFVSFSTRDRKKLADINEKGTANVVNACLAKKITLCHVSSIATINNLDYIKPLHEGVFWKTSGHESDYAITKYNAEREVWRGMEEGLDAVIVNPGVVLSPGFWQQSSSRLFDACYRGNRFYTDGLAAYVAAPDVARIMVDLVAARFFANRYILVENNYTFHEILNTIHKHLGRPLPSVKSSRAMLRLAAMLSSLASFFTLREPKITKAVVQAAFNRQRFSGQKILEALDTRFIPVQQTIADICRAYLSEKSNTRSST